ncbi:hypothetical protein M405DRAFT_838026 [Rhizopogon salebrosus TDB-379]|nr:hypothetical protein M405DRAFT_838026 [Rhizopogon salebrosus TDB-379]
MSVRIIFPPPLLVMESRNFFCQCVRSLTLVNKTVVQWLASCQQPRMLIQNNDPTATSFRVDVAQDLDFWSHCLSCSEYSTCNGNLTRYSNSCNCPRLRGSRQLEGAPVMVDPKFDLQLDEYTTQYSQCRRATAIFPYRTDDGPGGGNDYHDTTPAVSLIKK